MDMSWGTWYEIQDICQDSVLKPGDYVEIDPFIIPIQEKIKTGELVVLVDKEDDDRRMVRRMPIPDSELEQILGKVISYARPL